MNAINYCTNTVKHIIPMTILSMVFNNTYRNLNLDSTIYNDVIKSRVLPDLDVTGGVMYTLPLSKCVLVDRQATFTVYRIPPELRDNKPILSVLSIIYSLPIMKQVFTNLQDVYKDKANDRNVGVPIHSNARIELLSDDTFIIHEELLNGEQYSIRLLISNDPYLNNIQPRYYPDLAILVTHAVKAYIYNNLSIMLDKGFIQTGHKLDNAQRIVDKYEDSNEMYMELLQTKWYKLQFMNRGNSMKRNVSWMIPNDL